MRKVRWDECHEAMIGARTYVINKEPRGYSCCERRRELYDCYSSTRVDRECEIGRAKTLDDAKRVCVEHAQANLEAAE